MNELLADFLAQSGITLPASYALLYLAVAFLGMLGNLINTVYIRGECESLRTYLGNNGKSTWSAVLGVVIGWYLLLTTQSDMGIPAYIMVGFCADQIFNRVPLWQGANPKAVLPILREKDKVNGKKPLE